MPDPQDLSAEQLAAIRARYRQLAGLPEHERTSGEVLEQLSENPWVQGGLIGGGLLLGGVPGIALAAAGSGSSLIQANKSLREGDKVGAAINAAFAIPGIGQTGRALRAGGQLRNLSAATSSLSPLAQKAVALIAKRQGAKAAAAAAQKLASQAAGQRVAQTAQTAASMRGGTGGGAAAARAGAQASAQRVAQTAAGQRTAQTAATAAAMRGGPARPPFKSPPVGPRPARAAAPAAAPAETPMTSAEIADALTGMRGGRATRPRRVPAAKPAAQTSASIADALTGTTAGKPTIAASPAVRRRAAAQATARGKKAVAAKPAATVATQPTTPVSQLQKIADTLKKANPNMGKALDSIIAKVGKPAVDKGVTRPLSYTDTLDVLAKLRRTKPEMASAIDLLEARLDELPRVRSRDVVGRPSRAAAAVAARPAVTRTAKEVKAALKASLPGGKPPLGGEPPAAAAPARVGGKPKGPKPPKPVEEVVTPDEAAEAERIREALRTRAAGKPVVGAIPSGSVPIVANVTNAARDGALEVLSTRHKELTAALEKAGASVDKVWLASVNKALFDIEEEMATLMRPRGLPMAQAPKARVSPPVSDEPFSIKKGPNYSQDKVWDVTLGNGQRREIIFDSSTKLWYENKPAKGVEALTGTSKSDLATKLHLAHGKTATPAPAAATAAADVIDETIPEGLPEAVKSTISGLHTKMKMAVGYRTKLMSKGSAMTPGDKLRVRELDEEIVAIRNRVGRLRGDAPVVAKPVVGVEPAPRLTPAGAPTRPVSPAQQRAPHVPENPQRAYPPEVEKAAAQSSDEIADALVGAAGKAAAGKPTSAVAPGASALKATATAVRGRLKEAAPELADKVDEVVDKIEEAADKAISKKAPRLRGKDGKLVPPKGDSEMGFTAADLLTFLGRVFTTGSGAAAGSVYGYQNAPEGESKTKYALAGGAAGGLMGHLGSTAVLRSLQGKNLADMAKKYQYFSLLSDPSALGRATIGSFSSILSGIGERVAEGRWTDVRLGLKQLMKDNAMGYFKILTAKDQSVHLPAHMRQAFQAGGRASTGPGYKVQDLPGRVISAGDIAASRVLDKMGFSREEILRMNLGGNPQSKMGRATLKALGEHVTYQDVNNAGQVVEKVDAAYQAPGADLLRRALIPFARMTVALPERTIAYTPGLNMIPKLRKTFGADPLTPLSKRAAAGRGALGAGAIAGGYIGSGSTDPQNDAWLAAAGGPMSGLVGLGIGARRMMERSQPLLSQLTQQIQTLLPGVSEQFNPAGLAGRVVPGAAASIAKAIDPAYDRLAGPSEVAEERIRQGEAENTPGDWLAETFEGAVAQGKKRIPFLRETLPEGYRPPDKWGQPMYPDRKAFMPQFVHDTTLRGNVAGYSVIFPKIMTGGPGNVQLPKWPVNDEISQYLRGLERSTGQTIMSPPNEPLEDPELTEMARMTGEPVPRLHRDVKEAMQRVRGLSARPVVAQLLSDPEFRAMPRNEQATFLRDTIKDEREAMSKELAGLAQITMASPEDRTMVLEALHEYVKALREASIVGPSPTATRR